MVDNTKRREPLTEQRATALAEQAVDLAGGARMVYRNPRQAFSTGAIKTFDVDGFDSSLMPATGTPEPGGFFFDEACEILRAAAATGR